MDEFEKELAEFGHVKVPNKRCTARYRNEPSRVQGPPNLPVWCDLPAGHEGPHRHGTGHRSFIMDRAHLIEMVPLPEVCQECGTVWPCKEAQKLTKAISIGEARGRVLGMGDAAWIAESNILAPNTPWGQGAAYNAKKIADAIRQAAQGTCKENLKVAAQTDGVCEWEVLDNNRSYQPECEAVVQVWQAPKAPWQFCPYCGRPIKIKGE